MEWIKEQLSAMVNRETERLQREALGMEAWKEQNKPDLPGHWLDDCVADIVEVLADIAKEIDEQPQIWERELKQVLQEKEKPMDNNIMAQNQINGAIENLNQAKRALQMTGQLQGVALLNANIASLEATLNDVEERVKADNAKRDQVAKELSIRSELADKLDELYGPIRQFYWDTRTGTLEDLSHDLNDTFEELLDAITTGKHERSGKEIEIGEVEYVLYEMRNAELEKKRGD